MQNKLTKRIIGGGVVSAIGVVMSSLGGAAAAELSPQDRCAIAKLEATWQEAKCLTDAQTKGIRQDLTDEHVDRLKAACRQREQQSFENAEDRPGKCKTIDDSTAVDYALTWATDIPRACGESGPPCNVGNPETLSTATLQNGLGREIYTEVHYAFVPFICSQRQNFFSFGGPTPERIPPGHTGRANAGACLITRIVAATVRTPPGFRCEYRSSGTLYRTFQVVYGPDGCVVNRP